MSDYEMLNDEYSALFNDLSDLNVELDPVLEDALMDNIIFNDLFYQAVESGNLEEAEMWGRYALEAAGVTPEYCGMNATCVDELENFVPNEGNDAYDAADSMEYWEFQGDTNRCAQFSQMFVIEQITGFDLDPDDFCEFAEQNGWFSEEGGTPLEDMNKMLDYFGIQNEMTDGNSFDDLLNCLENGGNAIVAIDADEVWYGEGFWDDTFDLSDGANHAIEVIGFDEETNSVIVNDSGNPNGCGVEIPLDTFLDAWEDSNNYMIECYGLDVNTDTTDTNN